MKIQKIVIASFWLLLPFVFVTANLSAQTYTLPSTCVACGVPDVLPNKNHLLIDYGYNAGAGAVYILDKNTSAVLSMLTGTNPGDKIGSESYRLLPGGNIIVLSPNWNN